MRSLKNLRKSIEGTLTRAENSLAMLCDTIRRGLEEVEKEASALEESRLAMAQQLEDAKALLKVEQRRAEHFKAIDNGERSAARIIERSAGTKPLAKERVAKRTVHQKILWALGTYGPLTRAQVYYYTGVSPTSSTANTAYADLVEDKLVTTDRGVCTITDQGHDTVAVMLTGAPDPYVVFTEFCARQSKHLQKILRWHYQCKYDSLRRAELCAAADVSMTSSSTNTALARLGHLKIVELGGGNVVFADWYLKAIRVSITVHDTSRGTSRRHDVVEGKPL